jgi:acylphosphatase
MAAEPRKSIRVHINGRVQGVWFRAWTVDRAIALGLDGWVRNCADGTVEALFSGPTDAVDRMLDLCWEGPPAARVEDVVVESAPAPERPGFGHRPS